jgi:hypothetical protein
MKHIKKYNESKNNNEDNLTGFIRKLNNILDDKSKIEEIISLFPKSIIMPMFYKGDEATLIDSGDVVTITDISWKNGEYIYYFENNDGDEVYTYESEFILPI